jgi:hypothetical protein
VPAAGERGEVTEAILAVLRRSGLRVAAAGDWEDRDAVISASALVAGDLVTSAFPAGTVQLRARRRVRKGAAGLAVVAGAAATASAGPAAGTAVAAVVAADAVVGFLRTGRAVRAAVTAAATGPAVDGDGR